MEVQQVGLECCNGAGKHAQIIRAEGRIKQLTIGFRFEQRHGTIISISRGGAMGHDTDPITLACLSMRQVAHKILDPASVRRIVFSQVQDAPHWSESVTLNVRGYNRMRRLRHSRGSTLLIERMPTRTITAGSDMKESLNVSE